MELINEIKEGERPYEITTKERVEGILGLITFGGVCLTIIQILTQ